MVPSTVLGGSWYLLTNYDCTYNCTYNHIRALKGLISGLQVQLSSALRGVPFAAAIVKPPEHAVVQLLPPSHPGCSTAAPAGSLRK